MYIVKRTTYVQRIADDGEFPVYRMGALNARPRDPSPVYTIFSTEE